MPKVLRPEVVKRTQVKAKEATESTSAKLSPSLSPGPKPSSKSSTTPEHQKLLSQLNSLRTGAKNKVVKFEKGLSNFAEKSGWIPVVGDLAKEISNQTEFASLLWFGVDSSGKYVPIGSQRAQAMVGKFAQSQKHHFKAAITAVTFLLGGEVAALGKAAKVLPTLVKGKKATATAEKAATGIKWFSKFREGQKIVDDLKTGKKIGEAIASGEVDTEIALSAAGLGLQQIAPALKDPYQAQATKLVSKTCLAAAKSEAAKKAIRDIPKSQDEAIIRNARALTKALPVPERPYHSLPLAA